MLAPFSPPLTSAATALYTPAAKNKAARQILAARFSKAPENRS
jgi:hypothetical protein